ncbi:MAG: 6-phosphogluconolactonase [Myxococcota bacterium]|nr:6-phosphogluconolactonase [Myxococcota bacterium]
MTRTKKELPSVLVQESTGFHLGISKHLENAANQAAAVMKEKFDDWHTEDWQYATTEFTQNHFVIAIGGGNTVKAEYAALLEQHALDIDWIEEVRFFLLEESSGELGWESAYESLIDCFIRPLADRLIAHSGRRKLAKRLELERSASAKEIETALAETLVFPFDLSKVSDALEAGDAQAARAAADEEARRYRAEIVKRLGASMSFHMIISGIGKDGGLGAFSPYTPALAVKRPAVTVIEQPSGALRVALNRGVLTGAGCVSLIVSGSLKLKAIGRLEMEESTDFETTVMETPLRMLRETYEIAEKVYIFADERALHFDETVFSFRENASVIRTKAEVRQGSEEDGVHVMLLHGFMGLYSYINFLIRLPSAWTVSALRRGSDAKEMPDGNIFPHYAKVLRKAILQEWRNGRPVATGYHSIAGIISDHLLLSLVGNKPGPLPAFEDLKKQDQLIVQALRAAGMVQLATWTPSDIRHIGQTARSLAAHMRSGSRLDYGGPRRVYERDTDGKMQLNERHRESVDGIPAAIGTFVKIPTTEYFMKGINSAVRFVFRRTQIQQRLSNREIPYALRIVGGRLFKKISFYGLLKEIDAATHDANDYQMRHLRALDIVVKYDIPYISIVHNDDFMVSANRHRQEYEYLVARRMEKEGVDTPEDLSVPTRLVVLQRDSRKLTVDPLNPHLMLMATSHEGDRIAREVTAAMTRFVNENLAAAIERGDTKPLPSVARWVEEHA